MDGIYWAPINIIIGLLESEKYWNEELVVLEGKWMDGVPAEE